VAWQRTVTIQRGNETAGVGWVWGREQTSSTEASVLTPSCRDYFTPVLFFGGRPGFAGFISAWFSKTRG
jgi:hypothetical protein